LNICFSWVNTLAISLHLTLGAQIFRQTQLGVAWGLLLVGITLNTIADVPYYFIEINGAYERPHPITGI
jgi:hypothetical protein